MDWKMIWQGIRGGSAKALTAADVPCILDGSSTQPTKEEMIRLGAVYACVNLISDSIGKMPMHVMDMETKQINHKHRLDYLLNVRPCEGFTAFERRKFLIASVLLYGNGYEWIKRDGSGRPTALIPLPPDTVSVSRDSEGHIWYAIKDPYTGEAKNLPAMDVGHYKGLSLDGINGLSVLRQAQSTIRAGLAAQEFNATYYENGGQPSGILSTDENVSKDVTYTNKKGETVTEPQRDIIRREWERVHRGPQNANRVAVLGSGLKYTALSISQSDAQFIETLNATVEDIGRFFGVPLYKLNAGKQSYSSNEQNAIEYVVSCLHPKVQQMEDEASYKLLTGPELEAGLWLNMNMMSELRGDSTARGNWYKVMRECGVYSPNDICEREDIPHVPGGDTRYASLNYVPLELFEELSIIRNGGVRIGQKPEN